MNKSLLYLLSALSVCSVQNAVGQKTAKTYKHSSEYRVAILDSVQQVDSGVDVTLGKSQTDSQVNGSGQGIHMLHTKDGDFRVEAPVNKGATFMSALAAASANSGTTAVTYHNKWFLDNVQEGTQVLFASHCSNPKKKHPNDPVRCSFWFPDPDSDSHEYATSGDFTAYHDGDNSNTAKTANALCGTGKLNAETEATLCVTKPIPPPPPPAQ